LANNTRLRWHARLVPDSVGCERDIFSKQSPMRVLLRSLQTNLFCAGTDEWVAGPGEAFHFQQVKHVALACHQQKLTDMEVVFRYEQPVCELRVPLELDWRTAR
jgi:hypothetical protein